MPDKRFAFSNFEVVPEGLTLGGKSYATSEHLYQALKTTDPEARERVRLAPTPAAAKRLGRKVPLREGWDEYLSRRMMLVVLAAKFRQEPFRSRLLASEGELVEWNTWHDTRWGRCTCPRHKGRGENVLGHLLMELRDAIRKEEEEKEAACHDDPAART